MKHNPLFVDSTRFHGDAILTQVELRQVLVYDDETVFVAISPQKGGFRRVAMRPQEDGSFGVKVSLQHQTVVSYRFEIEKEGMIIMVSRDYKTRVQYAILADWRPLDLDAPDTAPIITEASPEDAAREDWPRGQVASIRSMIDRFGL